MLKATHSRITKRFPTRSCHADSDARSCGAQCSCFCRSESKQQMPVSVLSLALNINCNQTPSEWQLKTRIGQSCICGIRFRNVAGPVVKIISPPSFGKLAVLGPLSLTLLGQTLRIKILLVSSIGLHVRGGGTSTFHVVVSIIGPPPMPSQEGRTPATRLPRRSNASMRRPWPPSTNKTSGCQVR
jgi:hypothetical protein